jgi:hypothetical protein
MLQPYCQATLRWTRVALRHCYYYRPYHALGVLEGILEGVVLLEE